MVNLSGGVATLIHWARANRAFSHIADKADLVGVRRTLERRRPDFRALADQVRRDGVVAIPGYWTAERCETARAELNRLIAAYPDHIQEYSNGSDKRMFGVESVSATLMEFHADPFLRSFGEFLCARRLYNFATLGARIVATEDNAGSGNGWHRDAHGFQFKSIIYLSDTTPRNGPFEYLRGSHTTWRAATDAMLGGLPGEHQTRFTDEEIDRLTARRDVERKSFPAPAGTLLLVNTSGVHRGMPLHAGQRHALTNYYYHHFQVDEARIAQFAPLIPGTAQRIRRDLGLPG